MTIKGHFKNGVVVPDEPCHVPDGAEVEIVVVETQAKAEATAADSTVWQRLQSLRGIAPGLPVNAADNHDAYVAGSTDQP
jgi:hypothetical protein